MDTSRQITGKRNMDTNRQITEKTHGYKQIDSGKDIWIQADK